MTRWRKVGAVASFEFLSEVRRIAYLIAVFGMPVFVLAYGGVITLIGSVAKKSESRLRVFGVVDQPGVLSLEGDLSHPPVDVPPAVRKVLDQIVASSPMPETPSFWGNVIYRPFEDETTAMAALKDKSIAGWFLLRDDYLATGDVDAYYGGWGGLGAEDAKRGLRSLLQDRLIRGRVPPEMIERVRSPIEGGRSFTLKPDGSLAPRSGISVIAAFAVPIGFAFLLFFSVFGTSMTLIQGTAVEKENKVVDVLLSSASPDEILAGKLLGLGGAGLLQIGVWFGMVGLVGLLFAGVLAAAGVEIAWGAIAAGLVFFLAGYLFLGSLMLGTGSLGSTAKEGQQWSIVWTLMAALPMMFLAVLMNEPHGTIARLLTWIPFCAPTVVVFRLAMDPSGTAWWEVAGSLAVLIVCTWLALRLGARLFRVGLLLTGSRPGLKEIIRQARLSL